LVPTCAATCSVHAAFGCHKVWTNWLPSCQD
jgi:hypothetical protein